MLEALLRLRQAACHPGLIDKKATGETSAKLETLLATARAGARGRPQGDRLFAVHQPAGDRPPKRSTPAARPTNTSTAKPPTARKPGRTASRPIPSCALFLISLKAGGVGLNLTAASYVFLLDPWWNPAVESQAIDRAHRIGQQQPVFAYRIIAAGTVEEKILKMQEEKRALADAIVAEDARVLKQLTAADLEQLLG